MSSCDPPKGDGAKPPPHQGGKPPQGEPHQGGKPPKRGSKPHGEPHQGGKPPPHQGDGAKPQPGKPPPKRRSTRTGRRPPRNCASAGAARVSARNRVRRERVRRMGIPPQVPGQGSTRQHTTRETKEAPPVYHGPAPSPGVPPPTHVGRRHCGRVRGERATGTRRGHGAAPSASREPNPSRPRRPS